MILNSIKNHIFSSVMTIKHLQQVSKWSAFILFPYFFHLHFTLKLKIVFYVLLHTLASNFKYLIKEDNGYKHIHKSNNHSLCFRSQSILYKIFTLNISLTMHPKMQDYIWSVCHCVLLKCILRIISISLIACFFNIQSKGAN